MNDFGNTYLLACKNASKEQGIDKLILDLASEGITATSEQTGGFTMCAYIELKDNFYIYANQFGAGIYDNEGFQSDIIQLDVANSETVARAVSQWIKKSAELLDESSCGACGEWSRQFAHNCSEGF